MDVQVLVGVLVGIVGVAGAVTVVVASAAGRFVREGRGEEHLLVAPRGARFGDATDLVLAAARAQEARAATVVRLDAHRRRRATASGHAA